MSGGSFRIAEGYVEVTADREAYDRTLDRLKSERNIVKVGLSLDDKDFSARLDRLTRDRLMSVKLRVDDTALAKLKLDNVNVKINPQIPDAALRRVQTQLDRLTADRVVRIRADVDTRVGAAEIRNLIQRRTARIGVDVDTRVAAADLANLTRTRTANVNANARTADARIALDRLARDRRANIDVGFGGGGVGGAAGSLGILSSRIAQIAAVALGALPTLASLGESLIQMGPAAAVAVPAVLSLATAFAAIKIGTSGISNAIKAALAPATTSGAAASSSIRAVQNAEEALAKAQQGVKDAEVAAAAARVKAARDVADAQLNLKNTVTQVADANHQAAEQVASAERDLTNAQKAARQAQLDLTAARKQAAQNLEDLNNQLADSQLSQREDVLALQDAEAKLAADKAAGLDQSSEQYQRDQLARDQAAQQLKEQQTQTQRLTDQTAEANAKGVEGSDQVAAAKQGVADANQAVADKTQALQDAQTAADRAATDGAQQIAKAERDLSDARAAQTKAATDGARQIADANQAVADAARSLADAQTAGAAATQKTAAALANLAPNARSFVAAVVALRGAWTALRLDVQNRLFAGLGASLTATARAALPALRVGLVGTAGVLNTMARNAASAVTNLAKTGTLKRLFAGLNDGLKPLARIPGQFITALAQLGVAAAPAFKRLTTAAGGFADRLSKQLTAAFKNGHLEQVIDNALGIAKQFAKLLGDAFGVVGNVMKAAAAGGGNALGALGAVLAELKKITALPEVQKAMTSIFKVINQVATLFAGSVGQAFGQLVMGLAPVADAISQVLAGFKNAGPLIGGLVAAVNPFLGILILIAPLLKNLTKPLVGLVQSVAPILHTLSDFASGLLTALGPVIGALVNVLTSVLRSLGPVMARIAPVILQVVNAIAGPLAQVVQSLIPAVGPLIQLMLALDLAFLPLVPQILQLIPPLTTLTLALVNLAVQVITPLVPLVTGLAAVLTGALGVALTLLVPLINTLVGALTILVNATSVATQAIAASFSWLWTQAKNIFGGLGRDISNLWKGMWTGLRNAWNSFWSGLSSAMSGAWNWAKSSMSSLRSSITGTWSGLWSSVSSTFTSLIGTVNSKIGAFASGAKKAFSNLRDSLGTIWNGIESKFSGPVHFVVDTVYNQGIRKMWNTVAGKISSKITLPSIPLSFNSGGIVPGKGTKDTVPTMLTPGERVLSLAEIAKLGGYAAIDRALGRNANTGPHFGLGGIVSGISGAASSAVSGVTGAVSSAAGWAKNIVRGGLADAAAAGIKAIVNPLIDRIPTGSGDLSKLVKAIPTAALSKLVGFLKDDDKKNTSGQINYAPGAGVAQWAPVILKALGLLGQPASWLGTVERRMNQESGGNPRAVNLWDSNAKAGYPSTGLMQVIRPTFQRWADQFVDTSPFLYGVSVNPLANTYAGLNYALHNYGSLSALNRPGGYDSGGLLMPGATMAVNRTGRPERVLTADQTAKVDAMLNLAATATPAGETHYHFGDIKISGTFDFSSPASRRQAAEELGEEMRRKIYRLEKSRK